MQWGLVNRLRVRAVVEISVAWTLYINIETLIVVVHWWRRSFGILTLFRLTEMKEKSHPKTENLKLIICGQNIKIKIRNYKWAYTNVGSFVTCDMICHEIKIRVIFLVKAKTQLILIYMSLLFLRSSIFDEWRQMQEKLLISSLELYRPSAGCPALLTDSSDEINTLCIVLFVANAPVVCLSF